MQLNTNVQGHLHGMMLNKSQGNPNLYTRICSEMKLLLTRLSHSFLEDVLSAVRFSSSSLNDSSVKGIPFSCSQAITSPIQHLWAGGFLRRTLWQGALSITISEDSSKFGKS
jgi:hypothetical protein